MNPKWVVIPKQSCMTLTLLVDAPIPTTLLLEDSNATIPNAQRKVPLSAGPHTVTWHLPTLTRSGTSDQVSVGFVFGINYIGVAFVDVPVNCGTTPAASTSAKPAQSSQAVLPTLSATQVADVTSTPATAALASTGSHTGQTIALGLAVLAGGVAMVVLVGLSRRSAGRMH